VIDPAQGANEGYTPNLGSRFVATVFRITDTSSKDPTSDNANGDAAVVGAKGGTYAADFDDVAGCTNFNLGDYHLNAGQSVTGCVVFQVSTSTKLTEVEWSPSNFEGGPIGRWRGVY
jgi:hypothetical protein